MRTYGEWRYSSIILDPGTRWRWVVGFTPRPLYPRGESPGYPLDRKLGGPQNRSGRCGEKILSLPGLELQNLGGPARSQSLYQLRHYYYYYYYCDVHAVGQQSTVRRLFTAVAMQRNNGSDQRFLCGPFRYWRHSNSRGIGEVFSLWSAPGVYSRTLAATERDS
jgi:hypothetical protein